MLQDRLADVVVSLAVLAATVTLALADVADAALVSFVFGALLPSPAKAVTRRVQRLRDPSSDA